MTHEEGQKAGWSDYPKFSNDLDITEEELMRLHEKEHRPLIVAWYDPDIDDYLIATNDRHGYNAYQSWLANRKIGFELISSKAKKI